MNQTDTDVRVLLMEVGGEALGAVYRAVLAACAAEADHQAGEAATGVCLDMRIHHAADMLKEAEDFTVVLEEAYDRFISAGQFLVWLIPARVVDGAAVEDIAASVASRILRDAFLE